MPKLPVAFVNIAQEIARITSMREQAVLGAFKTLECLHPTLAQALLEHTGSRQRAAYWMCAHQRAFAGSTAYELLAEGDLDMVWDQILGSSVGESSAHPSQSRAAY